MSADVTGEGAAIGSDTVYADAVTIVVEGDPLGDP